MGGGGGLDTTSAAFSEAARGIRRQLSIDDEVHRGLKK
jgi:hypothetical protein